MRIPPPKPSGIDGVLTALMIEGIYVPFTFEPLVNMSIPAIDLPFVACHETAHAAGFAREEEANLAAYIACMGSGLPAFKYSAVMTAARLALTRVSRADAQTYARLVGKMSARVRQDYLTRNDYWLALKDTNLARAANSVNGFLLKNVALQPSGSNGYEGFVDLLE